MKFEINQEISVSVIETYYSFLLEMEDKILQRNNFNSKLFYIIFKGMSKLCLGSAGVRVKIYNFSTSL
jgi:hypothetical protein